MRKPSTPLNAIPYRSSAVLGSRSCCAWPGDLTRRWQIVVYVLAVVNGVARIYLGAHNPLDIVGGAALGIALAGALNLVVGVPLSED